MTIVQVHHQQKFISAFTHTKPVGIFKVDVATIYHEKEHAFERKWAQLVDPNAIQVVFGHLLLSIAVTERGISSKVIFHMNFFLRERRRFVLEYSR